MRGLTPAYLIQRILMFLLTIWIAATIMFIIPRVAPGDPIQTMVSRMTANGVTTINSAQLIQEWRHRFGLDKPLFIQYLSYLGNVVTFQFGYSLASFPTTVQSMIAASLPWTLSLLSVATILSFFFGSLVGALLGWRTTPRALRAVLPFSLTFTSVPFFMLALILVYIFAFTLGWFPIAGAYGTGIQIGWSWHFIGSAIYHGILPAASIVASSMGLWALGMRGMMITVHNEDFLILARAKGLRAARVFYRYAIRNAILPQVTALALSLGTIVGGSVLVEVIFGYPGMGSLLYQAITTQDYALIQGVTFMLIFATAFAVLAIDLLYPLLDPRITYAKK